MKKRIIFSALLALFLAAASLLYRSGSAQYNPMPYTNTCGGGVDCPVIENGVQVYIPTPASTLAGRGWPMEMFTLQYAPFYYGYYHGIEVGSMAVDYLLAFAVVFLLYPFLFIHIFPEKKVKTNTSK